MIEIIETTLEQEVRLFVNYSSDNRKGADEVVMRYGWIAEYIASKYSKLGVNIDELYDAGMDSLLDAAAQYHLGKDGRFALFAFDFVRDGVYELIDEECTINHIDGLQNAVLRLRNAAGAIRNNVNNDSTDWRVANALGIDEADLLDSLYGSPIVTKENLKTASRRAEESMKDSTERASISLLKKAFKRFDEIVENYAQEDKYDK